MNGGSIGIRVVMTAPSKSMMIAMLVAGATRLSLCGMDGPATSTDASPGDVRAAVQRSLPYIEKTGTAWMHERKCNSCHNVTFLVWSHEMAADRGLEVDRTKLAEWRKWSLANALAANQWYGIRLRTVEGLKADGLPPALLAKLVPSGKNYTASKDFLAALEKLLGRENVERYQEILLRRGILPNDGGGPDTLSQLLLGRDAGVEAEEAESYRSVRSLLLEHQEPDGTWQAAGQIPGLQWSCDQEMNQATAMWSLLALDHGAGADEPATQHARELVLRSLKDSAPRSTLQSLALRLMVAAKYDNPSVKDSLVKELLEWQRPDGGWSWTKEKEASEAFSTGQALYVLGRLGRDGSDPVVQRAWKFLLQTQTRDGSWNVPQEWINRQHRTLNVYPYWGTAWSAIGLLQTLPGG
jgi:hypothetical protein